MPSLIDNARAFPARSGDLSRFSAGQQPKALFITCSDSRVVPSLITGVGPGELFELRTAGNIVPIYKEKSSSGEAATIEFAIEVLHIREIIVCGHSHCGAVNAILYPSGGSTVPMVQQWLADTEPHDETRDASDFQDGPAMTSAVQHHVRVQLERLRGHPSVAKHDGMRLNGWFYAVHTGTVSALDPTDDTFKPL